MRFVGGFGFLALAMAAQALLPSAADTSLFRGSLLDAGHVPLFAVFALLTLWLSRLTVPGTGARHYLVAFALVVLDVLGTEFIQKFGARDAAWTDFLRDLIGGAAALFLILAIERRHPVVRVGAILLALLLLAVGLAELVQVTLDYRARNEAFPTLAGFDAPWEPRFVHGHDAELVSVPAPAAWVIPDAGLVGQLDTQAVDYPSLSIREPVPDWGGYNALEFVVWSDLAAPIDLFVRIHDRQHDGSYTDRYNGVFRVGPGANHVSVSLADVQAAPRDRSLDLEHVTGVAIFLERPGVPVRLWFDELRLVRARS